MAIKVVTLYPSAQMPEVPGFQPAEDAINLLRRAVSLADVVRGGDVTIRLGTQVQVRLTYPVPKAEEIKDAVDSAISVLNGAAATGLSPAQTVQLRDALITAKS